MNIPLTNWRPSDSLEADTPDGIVVEGKQPERSRAWLKALEPRGGQAHHEIFPTREAFS
jgi:hypothetical protein